MSSTARGGIRAVSDYYQTPQEPIRAFLKAWQADSGIISLGSVLDPCAGGDSFSDGREYLPMAYPKAMHDDGIKVESLTTIDLREDSRADQRKVDFLRWHPDRLYNTIISNPPFALAQEFIHHGLSLLEHNGALVYLLRLNFFGSKKRLPLFGKTPPTYAYVHHERISFTPDGKTDSIEYMHAVWYKDQYPTHTKLRVI